MNTKLNDALAVLKKEGLKLTTKRKDILAYLFEENRYVSAKEVYDSLSATYTGMSYDTVYRNLHDFEQLSLIEVTELDGEKKFRFHCSYGDHHGHHHHFICTECGATREISLCPMDFFKEQLPGCVIEDHRFEILGKCEICAKR
ncbi:Fur family transcriptional regulator [Vagococcus acidifermentans]|uniref:Transcriptional repressor n=1 Tax=Vagococcus acidifermentans TaxID=564710 RepID=A0A430AY06_9ENTE|nr:Fur family transcriptional regulator [Vagococcus acidifermentans]RSU12960.1 transcriptional repressor [Vagococcus acidifermentans]